MKKGFTLVELLAVIVILAIIALITVPIVTNVLSSSKKETKEVSVRNYVRAVEQSLLLYEIEETSLSDGTYIVTTNGNICITSDCSSILSIELEGEKPSSGNITIKDNKVISISNLKYNNFYGNLKDNEITISESKEEKACYISNDVDSDGIADIGDMITCGTESFYVISNDGENIEMLAEKNITLTLPQQTT